MRKTDVNTTNIDEKTFKKILGYVSTLRNADEVRMMLMFNFLAGMRRINFIDLCLGILLMIIIKSKTLSF